MRSWNQFDITNEIDGPRWQDKEGLSPLHLSVINEHVLTTKALLQADNDHSNLDEALHLRSSSSKSVLSIAAKLNTIEIVKLLVTAGFDVNQQDSDGETALHVVARFGHEECAAILLDKSYGQNPLVDIPEKTFAWTPLFIACVDGHLSIAKLLLEAGADVERLDTSGWSATEHASLRGHLDIARCIGMEVPPALSLGSDYTPTPSSSPSTLHSLDERRSNGITDSGSMRAVKAIKTFGHRYLVNETMVLVSLGSMDQRKQIEPVKLDAIPIANAHSTQLDTALSIVVSASGATGEPTVIDLPPQENVSTEPITFMTTDATKVKLLFDIVPTYAGSNEKIVGRGVALLSTIRANIGSKRMNLQGDMSVPVVSAHTLEVIGCVNFNFLIITPFVHPQMSISKDHTYWKSMASTMVIGHRGMPSFESFSTDYPNTCAGLGKNMAARKSLQLGENTIQVSMLLLPCLLFITPF
jgi:glycerophosphodiester phosphodiesterase